MNPVKLARKLDSRHRRVRRFVESDVFKAAYNKSKDDELVINMIVNADIEKLKEWAYRINPLVDAPLRWLRDKAKQQRIKDYSRKTKVELVDELATIDKLPS